MLHDKALVRRRRYKKAVAENDIYYLVKVEEGMIIGNWGPSV